MEQKICEQFDAPIQQVRQQKISAINPQFNQQHHDSCTCPLCQKQQQIQKMRKLKKQMHVLSCYKNDFFMSKKKKQGLKDEQLQKNRKQRSQRKDRRDKSQGHININHFGYLDLQSTYNNSYVNKKSQIIKIKPLDNLGGISSYLPASTTYMRSYNSTMTPRPDDSFKRIQMPVGTTAIPFSSETIYQKAFNRQHSPKPNLPFLHPQAISKPKSIGVFQSTHKKSYTTINPQKNNELTQKLNLKPVGNLGRLASFAHNYDTTYKNFFIATHRKNSTKHDIDQIGNIYMRRGVAHKY